MAPEIVGSENYDYSVDIWSLGILLYELLYGHSPFKASSTKNIILNIKTHELSLDDKNKKISSSCKDLITKLLNSNPQKRLKIKDILEHPFVKKHSRKLMYTKKLSSDNKDDQIKNKLQKQLNDNMNDNDNNNDSPLFAKELKRANTKIIMDKNCEKLGRKLFSDKGLFIYNENEEKNGKDETKVKSRRQSNKQFELLEKFRDSLNIQLEKAKKSIENISFKNTENCTFEDFRDGQFNSDKQEENNNVAHNKKYRKHESSKYNNYMFNGLCLDSSEIKNSNINNNNCNSNKKSGNNKNVILENEFEDIVEGAEELAALDRLNKAYERFGKENLSISKE
jgi:serine/threonine protein kinase